MSMVLIAIKTCLYIYYLSFLSLLKQNKLVDIHDVDVAGRY